MAKADPLNSTRRHRPAAKATSKSDQAVPKVEPMDTADFFGIQLAAFLANLQLPEGTTDEVKTLVTTQVSSFSALASAAAVELGLHLLADDVRGDLGLTDEAAEGTTRIKVTGPQTGRWRIGQHFTPEPKIIDVTAEQLAAIAADPNLSHVAVTD